MLGDWKDHLRYRRFSFFKMKKIKHNCICEKRIWSTLIRWWSPFKFQIVQARPAYNDEPKSKGLICESPQKIKITRYNSIIPFIRMEIDWTEKTLLSHALVHLLIKFNKWVLFNGKVVNVITTKIFIVPPTHKLSTILPWPTLRDRWRCFQTLTAGKHF